jgi:hypothetical protein
MKRAGVRVGTGTRFVYDGEVIEIVELHCVGGAPEVVARHVRTETVCRIALNELMFSPRSRLLSEDLIVESADDSGESASVRWSAASESERAKARDRATHVREALTGYQSGTPFNPLPGEPRAPYRQHLPKGNRLAAKADEIGVTLRTFARWVSRYEKGGEVELLSAKAL